MTDHQPQNKDGLDALLRWLSPDSEQAGQRYLSLRRALIEIFARRGVPSFALDELADETLDRAGRKLADGEVIHHPEPMAYLHGVARHVLSEYWRKQSRWVNETLFEERPPRNQAALESKRGFREEKQELERWLDCLDELLKSLPPEDEALLRACHQEDPQQQVRNRRAAAKRLGLVEASLRSQLHRIRQTLERKVRACVERHEK